MLSAEFPERLRGRRIVAKRIPNVVGSRNVASQDPIPPAPTPSRRATGRHARIHLTGGHVDLVDIRTLFAINLDAHEVTIHNLRNLGLLKGLPLHHVAPVTGGVPNREEDRHVAFTCRGKCLFSPWIPVHWVVGVLKQIGAGLFGQTVGPPMTRRIVLGMVLGIVFVGIVFVVLIIFSGKYWLRRLGVEELPNTTPSQ